MTKTDDVLRSAEGVLTTNRSNRKASNRRCSSGSITHGHHRCISSGLLARCTHCYHRILTDTWHPNNVRVILHVQRKGSKRSWSPAATIRERLDIPSPKKYLYRRTRQKASFLSHCHSSGMMTHLLIVGKRRRYGSRAPKSYCEKGERKGDICVRALSRRFFCYFCWARTDDGEMHAASCPILFALGIMSFFGGGSRGRVNG